jgi:HAD superfamily hydrolase (TIGR01509 family)
MDVLIFDMDGVVVDSVGYWNDVRARLIADELGVDNVAVSELVGLNAEDEYAYLAERHDLELPKETYVSLLEEHAEEIYRERVSLFSDCEQVLTEAIENDVRLGLVSASCRRRVEMVVDRFDLHEYFDIVVAGNDVPGPSKPEPAIYEHALTELGAAVNECLAVEDSNHGVTAATRAGLYCLGYACHRGQPLRHADETIGTETRLCQRLIELCRSGSMP